MELKDILKKPIITEKTTRNASLGKYTFEVDKRATKKEVATAVEKFFGVQVLKTWTVTLRGKIKKATVQLKEG
ncbi:50S ribosomal protein L23, partial [Patescibacteria group bacterium]